MKFKIMAVLTALILSFQCAVFAEYQVGITENTLTISGTANPKESVSFIILDADVLGASTTEEAVSAYHEKLDGGIVLTATDIFNFQSVVTDKDGEWSYKMPMSGIETKNLVVIPSIGDAEYLQYSSISFRKDKLSVIKDAALDDGDVDDTDDDHDSLNAGINSYVGYFTNKASQYKDLTNKKRVAVYTKEIIKGLDLTTDEAALEALTEFTESINDAIHVCNVIEGKTTDFDKCMEIVSYNESLKNNITDEGKTKIVEILKNGNYKKVSDFCDEAQFQYVLQMFNYNVNQNGDNLLSYVEKNNNVLKLDLTQTLKLTPSNQALAMKKLALEHTESSELAQDALDVIAEELYNKENSGGGGGGGGGIGSDTTVPENKPHNSSSNISISNEYIENQKYIYPDMRAAAWAADSIVYLNKLGIVNGYEDNTFRPLNPVTRAEFTKLVVEALFKNRTFDFKGNFKDVPQNEWYAEHVNTAYNMGIVSGDGKGYFNPDATITREDMAVIIYNAGVQLAKFEKADKYIKFTDDSSISDYAKDAVYTLRNASIINGVGDGVFAPNDVANRASAAKIIYSLITQYIE